MEPAEVVLTNVEMHPIPLGDILPTYHQGLLRAPPSVLSHCYIKKPSLHDYDGSTHKFKGYILAEIEAYETLRMSPHPNIAEYLGCFVKADNMIHGICLAPYDVGLCDLAKQNPLSIDIQGCVEGIRKGIEHLHKLGMVHNDIKPKNIMMHKGEPVIIDFDSCVREGGNLIKVTFGWSLPGIKKSEKTNDYYGLELIEKWLVDCRQQFEANKQ